MLTQTAKIAVGSNDHGVLIFHTWRNKVPPEIQVLHACGSATGDSTTPPEVVVEGEEATVRSARFAFDTFTAMCSIDNVVVSESENGYCRVYVNWSANAKYADPKLHGWSTWGDGAYKLFLRELFNRKFKNVKLKSVNGKTSVRFSDKPAKGPVETEIVFVREKATGRAA